MIIFGVMMFGLMLAIGGLSFDLMRFEAHRERLQSTLDRAVLAAASLTQSLDPKAVVLEYFAKAGMSDFIDPKDVVVTEGVNYRKVEARAYIRVPLHHGTFAAFTGVGNPNNELIAAATSIAEESVGNVEISMVLDVSGSMNSYNRLPNLKSAAKDFMDTVYQGSEDHSVSTSIIPYATQVNAGQELLSHYLRDDSHEDSHCINFETADFASTSISTTTPMEQTVHFDPWTNESSAFDLGEYNDPSQFKPVCPGESHREILAWSTSKTQLKAYIDALTATGNTSTDIGVKWGAALLDPGTQSVLTSMINSGSVTPELAGRPYAYSDSQALKVLIVMTDGAHTNQYFMNNYRTGNSFVWRHEIAGTVHYSIWYDGEGSAPITTPVGSYTYCQGASWSNGSCGTTLSGSSPDFWFHAWSDDGINNTYEWLSTPYGGASAQRMTWQEVWSEIPPEYFSDEVLYAMGSLNDAERNAFEYAIDYVGTGTKNSRFDTICQAVKDQEVIIFAIGLEVTRSNARRLRKCASSPSHYYNAKNTNMGLVFQNIAAQINQLRLIQ